MKKVVKNKDGMIIKSIKNEEYLLFELLNQNKLILETNFQILTLLSTPIYIVDNQSKKNSVPSVPSVAKI